MFYIMSNKMLCSWVVHPVDVARATTYVVAHGERNTLKPNSLVSMRNHWQHHSIKYIRVRTYNRRETSKSLTAQ